MGFDYREALSNLGSSAADIGDTVLDHLTPEVDDEPSYGQQYPGDRLDVVSEEELRERRRRVEEELGLDHEPYHTLEER